MDNTIKIISEILIREYYDLERAFRKILKSIGSYTFDYNKIDDFVEMVDYNGIEYIINGFYHDSEGNIFLNCLYYLFLFDIAKLRRIFELCKLF